MDAIHRLEQIQSDEINILKRHFHISSERLNPKMGLDNLHGSPKVLEIKSVIVNSAVGLITGYLSKKVFIGSSKNPIRRFLGNVIMIIITNEVSNNPESVKSLGLRMLNVLKGSSQAVKS